MSADLAICASEESSGRELGCRLIVSSDLGPSGPRAVWSSLPHESIRPRRAIAQLDHTTTIGAGMWFTDRWSADETTVESLDVRALAEGIALTPAGPQEVVLLREISSSKQGGVRFRFVAENGRDVATIDMEWNGRTEAPVYASILAEEDRLADDGIQIPFERLSNSLKPGTIGFMQFSYDNTGAMCLADTDCSAGACIGADTGAVPPVPGSCRLPLADLRTGWTTISDAIAIDQTNVPYQTDPSDGTTAQTLPEVWDFASLNTSNLMQRTFNSTRNDTTWNACLESCALRDITATPADGTWQSYLKIDNYNSAGVFVTRDIFEINDNDTGANPSIDVPYITQDQANASDRTQICFDDSGGNSADRFFKFFQFTGPDTASAVVGVGDTWSTGNWTSCNDGSGLHLTLASTCGNVCYPGCPDGAASPRAQGLLGGGAGLRNTIQEDGYIHVSAGNYIPALLMLQETDLEAGADLFGVCNVSPTRLRGIDWFWVHERYGLLALISGANDDGSNPCGQIQPTDWSCFDNRTDGADFTWGPYPPYQIRADACLNGTRIEWELPADGSNLTGEPGVSDWGYVVSWGTETDPEALAEWSTNPNHTPLPGQPGYLAAPPGGEPTGYTISGFGGSAIHATVVTSLQYTDPDAADTTPYRSGAFFKVTQDPATLDPAVFQVGDAVDPFVTRAGSDLTLSWPAVAGASSYSIEVFDLDTRQPIVCPVGLDCAPVGASTVFSGAATSADNYAFRVFAVDRCGGVSSN